MSAMTTPCSGEKIRMIIDTDGVSDDIRAISIALQHPDVEIVAFTTTHGCVSSLQAAANVARTQRANGVKTPIPIYKGAGTPLIERAESDETFFFGKDGLGDQPEAFPPVLESDFNCWESEPAASALIRLTRENPDIVLVCIVWSGMSATESPLGPLTNIALALKLDEDFKRQPKKVVCMGGNFYASIELGGNEKDTVNQGRSGACVRLFAFVPDNRKDDNIAVILGFESPIMREMILFLRKLVDANVFI